MTEEPDPRLVALGLVPAAPIEKKKEEKTFLEAVEAAAAAPPPSAPVPSGTDQLFRGMGKFTGMPAVPAPPAGPHPAAPGHSAIPPGFVAPSPSRGAPPSYTPPPRPPQAPAKPMSAAFAPPTPEAPLREAPPPLPPLAAVVPAAPVPEPPRPLVRRGRPMRTRRAPREPKAAAKAKPLAPQRPPLPPSTVLLKGPIVMGFPEKEYELTLEQLGFRIDAPERIEIAWSDVREIKARRGRVAVRTKGGKPVTFTIAVDGVGEPSLAAPLARVVKESSGGRLDLAGSAVLELQNASDTLRDRFHDEDDPVIPALVGLIFVFAGFVLTGILPDALAISARTPYAPGAFLIDSPLASFDPRILLASFAAAAGLAAGVVRVAMGKAAMAWALGTLRGWHEGSRPAVDTGRRLLALIVIYPGIAAAVLLGAIVLALPSLRVQTLIDEGGVHLLRPLPIFDDDRTWETVSDLKTVPAPTTQHFEGVAVIIRFEDGSTVSTLDGRLRGGTDKQLLASATLWRDGPPP